MHTSLSQLVLASANPKKIVELRQELAPLNLTIRMLSDFSREPIKETGISFIENALIKARYGTKISQLPCLADDSGLMVPALNNAPGIYSARYAGKNALDSDNRKKLLAALMDKAPRARKAFFCCVMALLEYPEQANPFIAMAYWHGRIATMEQGDKGFGYDAIFVPLGYKKTAAQLKPRQKNEISHRGQALRQVADFIRRRDGVG